ncbi:MAG TPA: hypothetical protein VMR17_18000 [Xanthobacteraceae bacterium]|nr:hypothetical protein [Xanthobacteraceae bacterium]
MSSLDRRFVIQTRLMAVDKAATFALAHDIGAAIDSVRGLAAPPRRADRHGAGVMFFR